MILAEGECYYHKVKLNNVSGNGSPERASALT